MSCIHHSDYATVQMTPDVMATIIEELVSALSTEQFRNRTLTEDYGKVAAANRETAKHNEELQKENEALKAQIANMREKVETMIEGVSE